MNKDIEELLSYSKFGIKLGLDNMTKILDIFNNPQESYEIIHIGGTNGKGSTSTFIETALVHEGYKVGKYSSPYLIEVNEMFVINQQQIDDDLLAKTYRKVKVQKEKHNIDLTLYEMTTTIMLLICQQLKVDYLILEVGLGGRYDATNIVIPKVSVITNVTYDHINILGDTIEKIAYEKAGIIKQGVKLFTASEDPVVIDIFKQYTNNIEITNITDDEIQINYEKFTTIAIINDEEFTINLFGVHQAKNFKLAYSVLKYLNVSKESIIYSAENSVIQGRLEKLSSEPLIIFDGAHNVDAAKNLVNSLKGFKQEKIVLFSILNDKEVLKVVEQFKKLNTHLFYIEADEYNRSLSYESLVEQVKDLDVKITKIDNAKTFIDEFQDKEKMLVVCGTFSLYKKI